MPSGVCAGMAAVVVDVPENLPGAGGDGAAVEFGHSSAVHLNGAFRGHRDCPSILVVIQKGS